ncbi:MAG: hypothetical protein KAI17_21715 [Thiotrichaceae bacterium]|nr:hypothetical protein [Thiotrichaceae bacterium]
MKYRLTAGIINKRKSAGKKIDGDGSEVNRSKLISIPTLSSELSFFVFFNQVLILSDSAK